MFTHLSSMWRSEDTKARVVKQIIVLIGIHLTKQRYHSCPGMGGCSRASTTNGIIWVRQNSSGIACQYRKKILWYTYQALTSCKWSLSFNRLFPLKILQIRVPFRCHVLQYLPKPSCDCKTCVTMHKYCSWLGQPRKWCIMHCLNLGIYLVVIAEGILMIARSMGNPVEDRGPLKETYKMFKQWCTDNKIPCSQREFTASNLHLTGAAENYPWLKAKAYNARVILGWLSVSGRDLDIIFGLWFPQRLQHYFFFTGPWLHSTCVFSSTGGAEWSSYAVPAHS